MNRDKKITICSCVSRSFIAGEKVAVLASVLGDEGYDVTSEPDLCQKMMRYSADIEDMASSIVLACYPRAVRSLFQRFGLTPYQILDIRNCDIRDVLSRLSILFPDRDTIPGKEMAEEKIKSFVAEAGGDAWYPVIDKDRCNECRQCHDFCLFGVYEIEAGEVKVKHPRNCKNNCPACARICPTQAIIFPKYEKSPINGGLEEEESIGVDTKAVYNDALRMRLHRRRSGIPLKGLSPDSSPKERGEVSDS